MNLELKKGNQSNIDVNLTLTQDIINEYINKSLKSLQKTYKAAGFREGHVPMDIIKKQVDQEYVKANGIEMAVNDSIDKLLKDHSKDYQFIGDIYNMSLVPDGDDLKVSYTVDVYPVCTKLDDNFKNIKINKADDTVTEQDINSSYENLLSQYGEWKNVDEISMDTSARAKISFLDKDANVLEDSRVFVSGVDIIEHEIIKKNFLGKKINEEFEIEYNHEELPHTLHYHKDDQKPAKITLVIDAIQQLEKPQVNEENIKKRFGDENIKNEKDLKEKISEVIKVEKAAANLTTAVEKYLEDAGKSFTCIVPKTMVTYELNTRIENMSKRFGSKEKMEKYLEVMNVKNPNWKLSDYYAEIEQSATTSINKFFIFKKITEELGIDKDINREKELDPENKLYEFLNK